jgi:hypothetical protein
MNGTSPEMACDYDMTEVAMESRLDSFDQD